MNKKITLIFTLLFLPMFFACATLLEDTFDFESPDYSLGDIVGQDSWIGTSSRYNIVSSWFSSGLWSVQYPSYSTTGATISRSLGYSLSKADLPVDNSQIAISFDTKMGQLAGSQYLILNQGTGTNNQQRIYFPFWDTGSGFVFRLAYVDTFDKLTGLPIETNYLLDFDNSPIYSAGDEASVLILMDFDEQNMNFYVKEIGGEYLLLTYDDDIWFNDRSADTILNTIQISRGSGANDFFYDNIKIEEYFDYDWDIYYDDYRFPKEPYNMIEIDQYKFNWLDCDTLAETCSGSIRVWFWNELLYEKILMNIFSEDTDDYILGSWVEQGLTVENLKKWWVNLYSWINPVSELEWGDRRLNSETILDYGEYDVVFTDLDYGNYRFDFQYDGDTEYHRHWTYIGQEKIDDGWIYYDTEVDYETYQTEKAAEFAEPNFWDFLGVEKLVSNYTDRVKSRYPFAWFFYVHDEWDEKVSEIENREIVEPYSLVWTFPETDAGWFEGAEFTLVDFTKASEDYSDVFEIFRNLLIYVIWISGLFTIFVRVKRFFIDLGD